MMNDKVVYTEMSYDRLVSDGFNFDAFEYMANLYVPLDKQDTYGVIPNVKVLGTFAYKVDAELVLVINLKESVGIQIEKIDRSNIN